jgi:hypothetical protein
MPISDKKVKTLTVALGGPGIGGDTVVFDPDPIRS